MYTQCPQCDTVFMLTSEQLAARGGLVRCGRCNAVFRADYYLREHPHSPPPASMPEEEPEVLEAFAVNESADTVTDAPIPTITTLSESDIGVRKRGRPWGWGLGSLVLLSLLLAQYAEAYRPEWLQHPRIQPLVHKLCEMVPCPVHTLQDPEKIELVEAEVLPHPKYDRALRVSASLVNRADFVQPFPLLEITLTDNRGQVVARRTFQPRQYLEQAATPAQGMQPRRSARILLDLTSPGNHAVGYEIRLVVSPS